MAGLAVFYVARSDRNYLRAVSRKVLWSSACVCVSVRTRGGRAGGVRTLLQPARAQCLRLSERFLGSTP